jgi:VTC domain
MAHSREIRTHAFELKFVVTPEAAAGIRQWARTHLAPDPHGTGPFGDEYRTASLYFDTDDLAVFHRRGSFARSKYRIRRYGDEADVFLERKLRQPSVLAKRRTRTTQTSLEWLDEADVDPRWAGAWFHRRIVARGLRPLCQVMYHRTARAITINGDQARLTLDEGLSAHVADAARFLSGSGVPAFGRVAILELKYRLPPPAIFKQLVEQFALAPQIVSKYRLAMAALGHTVSVPAIAGADEITGQRSQASYA